MPRYDIEQWEKENAEVEIRRWLAQIGQWEPELELERLQAREAAEAPFGSLRPAEIDHVLRTELVGRIGCHAEGKTYVVPIVYAYDGTYIYGHSGEGMKVRMMRANPNVCFEVDHMDSLTNWQSVIAWGQFEELHGDEAERALQLIVDRLTPLMESATILPTHGVDAAVSGRKVVIYRIAVTRRTGRFERR